MSKKFRIIVFCLGLLIMFGFFSIKANTTPEKNFWSWFEKNESRIFGFESNQEKIVDEVLLNIKKVNPNLTIEITRVLPKGQREFVISADGNKTAFPAVEALFKEAPALERWTWVKFRPRMPIKGVGIKMNGKKVDVEDVNYILFEGDDKNKVGIMLFFDGFNEDNKINFQQIGFILLDTALGEYDSVTQVDFVEFQSRESEYFSKSKPLVELQAHFDEYFGRKVH